MSGIGKGVTTSSIGVILKADKHRVKAIKIDQYLNIDAGTMGPMYMERYLYWMKEERLI